MKATISSLLYLQAIAGVSYAAALPQENDKIILHPVPRPSDAVTGLSSLLEVRQAEESAAPLILKPEAPVVPSKDVFLGYAASDITALVNLALKRPAVVLEDIAGLSSVECSGSDISVTFSDTAALKAASAAWPAAEDFIMITYAPDNGCNTADQRGWWNVSALTFDEAALVGKVAAVRSALDEESEDADVEFDTAAAAASRRDITASVSVDLGAPLIDTDNFKLAVDQALFESSVRIKGSFRFNFLKFKPSRATLDIDYSGSVNLNISATVMAEYNTELLNIKPQSFSVSPFSIPGIIDVGPRAEFGVGIEFGASGSLTAGVDVHSEINNGQTHFDLLDSSKTTSSGWEPETSVSSNIKGEVSLQVNPYIDLIVAMGVNLFNGALDLSAALEAKPTIVNVFSASLDLAFTSQSGITFTQPEPDTCPNGAWFASKFNMDIDAYIGTLYRKTLFNVNAPIYETQCWSFV
ncbi:hypothetical protein B0J13DRAFT_592107 [Dactylonectria estremocensis]|uniref:DUF7029 domain-containing protein n=1 Tax=Dactylonectria estremocensis TaxID=1079267 RepID=A0A9P9JF81_9HYPO|nr:hypothetical protein B0J13DRAFT_592107 [Dactylonectria estremocensis]